MAIQVGMPGWVDLGTSDLEAATKFYTALFGWTAHVSPEPETGGYTIFNKDGRPVAGAGPLFAPEQPVAWSTYVITGDADETADRVKQAGGTVLMQPFDIMRFGRMAVFLDHAGAAFSVWQGGEMPGADVIGEPDTFGWAELMSRDPEGAKKFYGSVFGWTGDSGARGAEFPYTVFRSHGRPAAGMMAMEGDMWPADLPNHWMNYFIVEDTDAKAKLAAELGGVVSVPPTDIPPGRFAVLNDPQGGHFSIIKIDAGYDMS